MLGLDVVSSACCRCGLRAVGHELHVCGVTSECRTLMIKSRIRPRHGSIDAIDDAIQVPLMRLMMPWQKRERQERIGARERRERI